jgi:DNA-directed RNA polymerase specialized sigma24 family protein
MTTDLLSELRVFARGVLRDPKAIADVLRRAARALPRSLRGWAAELADPIDPLRRPATLAALADAFERRRDPRPERAAILDRAIESLSQDAQPVLTARYEGDLSLETVAWRFRTSPEHAMGALSRIRRLLLKALHGSPPNARFDEIVQKHLERAASRTEAEALAARVTSRPAAADAFADACRLDADLALYFAPEVKPEERTTSPRSSPARRPGRARNRT